MKMDEHKCRRCGHCFSTKGNLLQHFKRKQACKSALEDIHVEDLIAELTKKEYNEKTYDCQYCQRPFNTWQSRSRHHKICKEHPDSIPVEKVVPYSAFEKLLIEVEQLKKRVAESTGKNVTNNTNSHNTYNIQNNIVMRDFNRETTSYLEQAKDLLNMCFVRKDMASLVENMHCDADHPENHNIRLSSKPNLVEVWNDNKWIYKDEDEALTECIHQGYRVLVFHAKRHKNEIIEEYLEDEYEYEGLKSWLEDMYSDEREQKPVKKQLLVLLQKNGAVILGKDEK